MFTKNRFNTYIYKGLLLPVAFFAFGGLAHADTTTSTVSNAPAGLTVSIPAPEMTGDLAIPYYQATSVSLYWQVASPTYDAGALYDIRYSTSSINEKNFASATQFTGAPIPVASLNMSKGIARLEVVSGLSQNTKYYFALKSKFANSDWSPLSDVPSISIPTDTRDSIETITKDLSFGKTDDQVGALQRFLAGQGLFNAQINNKFDAATKAAVIAFQEKNKIKPASGYVGRVTRAAFARMVKKGAK